MNSVIEKRIELKAPVSRVWRALTDYREFGEWFRVKLDGPFAPGQLSRGRITYPGYEHVKWGRRCRSWNLNGSFRLLGTPTPWIPIFITRKNRQPWSSSSLSRKLAVPFYLLPSQDLMQFPKTAGSKP